MEASRRGAEATTTIVSGEKANERGRAGRNTTRHNAMRNCGQGVEALVNKSSKKETCRKAESLIALDGRLDQSYSPTRTRCSRALLLGPL